MITKAELENMVYEEAQKVSYENDMPYTSARNTFRSGASFVTGILMPEIEKLEKEIYRVIDVADGNSRACIIAVEENFKAKAEIEGLKDVERYLICPSCGVEGYVKDIKTCSDAIRVDLDKKDSDIRLLEKELSEANATIEYLKSGVHTCHDQCQKPICVKFRDKDATIQSLKDERDNAIKAMDYHINSDMRTQEENQSLKDENGRLNKFLLRIQVRIDETNRHEDDLDMISDLVAQALTHKAEE